MKRGQRAVPGTGVMLVPVAIPPPRDDVTRYVSCLSCGRFITKWENDMLRFNVACPECQWDGGQLAQQLCPQSAGAFGPSVWVDDYEGKTLQEAMAFRREKQAARVAAGRV